MRNRWYDPNSGRFTQQDPIGFAGGSNLYGYTGGDPVNFSDPFGLEECEKAKEKCEKKATGVEALPLGKIPAGAQFSLGGKEMTVGSQGMNITLGVKPGGQTVISGVGDIRVSLKLLPDVNIIAFSKDVNSGAFGAEGIWRLPTAPQVAIAGNEKEGTMWSQVRSLGVPVLPQLRHAPLGVGGCQSSENSFCGK